MKFQKNSTTLQTHPYDHSKNTHIENYIYNTKVTLSDNLKDLYNGNKKINLTNPQQRALQKFKNLKQHITIKPEDKNLGIVLLDTDDYLKQCTEQLADRNIYCIKQHFPETEIKRLLTNTIIPFKQPIYSYSRELYKYLQPTTKHRIPQFYGIPKIHKRFTTVLPIRPIISRSNSLLSHTAQLIDHVLQPLSQSYSDDLQPLSSKSLTTSSYQKTPHWQQLM